MPGMTDPTNALVSFQRALLEGNIRLQAGELDRGLFVHADSPTTGVSRITYVRMDGATVSAFATFVTTEPINGLPCFQVGVAVPVPYRSKGHAKSILKAAIAELKNGLSRNKIDSFYVESVVDVDNEASRRVSAATISSEPTSITDSFSGLPALQYLRKV